MKSEEVKERIREELEERGLNPLVRVRKRDRDFICKFYHVEGSNHEDMEWKWKVGAELVYYGQTDSEFLSSLEDKVSSMDEQVETMRLREEFPSEEFLDWVEGLNVQSVPTDRLEEEYPSFFDAYNLTGITMSVDEEGTPHIPVRDLRDCVRLGYCRD